MSMEYKLPYTAKEIEDKLEQIDSKLNASELTSAINVALNTAKNSGEFDGQDGEDGIGIDSATINDNGELVITYSNGTTSNLGKVVGEDGADSTDEIIVPDYWEEHLNGKIARIKQLQDEGGKDCFSFVVMTDMHYPANLGKNSPILAKKITDECDIKYVLVLGDVRNRGIRNNETKVQAQTEWNNIEEMFEPLKGKVLMTQGNHDAGYGTGDYDGDGDSDTFVYEFTPAEMFNRVYRKASFTGNVVYDASGTAFYVDDISNKVRYILLNTQLNFDGNRGYSSYETINGMAKYPSMQKFRYTQCQYDFLSEDALVSIPNDDWSVIIGSHIPINQTGEMPEYSVMVNLLNAYQKKASYNGTYKGTAEGGAVTYTNLAEPLPENTTDTTKWVNGYRFSSEGISPQSGTTVSNPIPCNNGDVIRIKGVTLRESTDRLQVTGGHFGENAVAYFNNGYKVGDNTYVSYDGLVEGVYTFTIKHEDITSFRFAMPTPANANDIIVTVNEEIIESEHGYDYVSVNCDFSQAKGKLICYNGGHVHEDRVATTCYPSGKLEFPIITTRCDAKEENDATLNGERIKGTTTEQSFDVFTINKSKGKIYATKIGAGSDREILI